MINLAQALRRAKGQPDDVRPFEDAMVQFAGDRPSEGRRWDFDPAQLDEAVVGAPVPAAQPAPSRSPIGDVVRDDSALDGSDEADAADLSSGSEPRGRRRWLIAAAIAGVLGVAGVLWQQQFIGNAAPRSREVVVTPGTIHRVVGGTGKVQAASEVRLTANLFGRIERVHVREGDMVQQGDLIAEMESADLHAQLDQARSRLEEARAKLAEVNQGARAQEVEAARTRVSEADAVLREARASLDRSRTLHERGLIARMELEEAQTRYERASAQLRSVEQDLSLLVEGARPEVRQLLAAQYRTAEAAVREAETQLNYASVRTPISGIVLQRFMEPGEVIVMQRPQPIVTVADISRLVARAEIDESDAGQLAVGQDARVTSTNKADSLVGRVVSLSPSVGRKTLTSDDPAEMVDSKVLEVTIELPANAPLKLGQSVDVEVSTVRRDNVLVVPRAALARNGEGWEVSLKSAARWEKRPVTVGQEDGERVEIRSGLKKGDVIAVREDAR